MRKLFLLPLLFCAALHLPAQTSIGDSKLDQLRTPSSPAFSILGVQPTEISRPNSFRALETTLSNSFFQNDKLIIPKNLAMEFNPFFSKPDMDSLRARQVLFGDTAKAWRCMRNNFRVSVATGTFSSYADTSLSNQRMGLGLRTQLVQMKATKRALEVFNAFTQQQTAITAALTIVDAVKQLSDPGATLPSIKASLAAERASFMQSPSTDPAVRTMLNKIFDEHIDPLVEDALSDNLSAKALLEKLEDFLSHYDEEPAFTESADKVRAHAKEKYGHSLEIATAMLLDFPTNDIAFSKVPKYAFWSTWNYRTENQRFEFGAMARFQTSKFDTLSRINSFDFGGRVLLDGGKWNLNAELIQRFQWELLSNNAAQNTATLRYSNDFKASLTVNYMLTQDIVVNYTFGNQFTINTEFGKTPGNLISAVGLVYAFGGPKISDYVK